MAEPDDMNSRAIAEFRANSGHLGGRFEGAPMVLVHHVGRSSGREFVTPMMCLPAPTLAPASTSAPAPASGTATDPDTDLGTDTVYVFASNGGFADNPHWYRNLVAAGSGEIEYGTKTFAVTVRELHGAERDGVYAEQTRRFPGFAEYERQTAGLRIIPVLELTRVRADG